MLGLSMGMIPPAPTERPMPLPAGFNWDSGRFPLAITKSGAGYRWDVDPRSLVDPLIWSGPAYHVDGDNGDDANSGLGATDGDFSAAKRTIWAAFVAGNATGTPYRVRVKAGRFTNSSFTRNGQEEPTQPLAILGWGGAIHYRTGPFSQTWADAGGTWTTSQSSVKRVLRTDVLTDQGLYTDLAQVADPATCAATSDSWCNDSGTIHVNIGAAPGNEDIALIRSFHGARFMSHVHDLFLENIHCEGGISGALHLDPAADRNVVAVDCSFRYSAPSNTASPLDAVQMRRTNGLVAFFRCDASGGAEDGWSFHEDAHAGMHVILQDCSGYGNGGVYAAATSCNAVSAHDATRLIDLSGDYGWSTNGTDIHCVENSHSWFAGTQATARDSDGTSVAFKCSNDSQMWLQDTRADAAGAAANYAQEVNGAGAVAHTRNHVAIAGDTVTSVGGSVVSF